MAGENSTQHAMVSLSGGQDSTTALYWALREFGRVSAVSFNYRQRHNVELDCAKRIAERADVPHVELDLGEAFGQMGAASLTNPAIPSRLDARETGNAWAAERGLPSSFVPGRNIILLGYAAAHAAIVGSDTLVAGVCETDDAGYPDCRRSFILALEDTVSLGLDSAAFAIETPLMYLSKAETWQLAADLGIVDVIIESTHTCYEGDHDTRHVWGYGCGECPACVTREAGWQEFAATLPA